MSSLDTSEADKEERAAVRPEASRSSIGTQFAHPYAPLDLLASTPGNDVYGLLRAFADTQQYALTGPRFAPISLGHPLDYSQHVNQVLSSITGSEDLSAALRAIHGNVTVWSLPSSTLPGIYSGVVYVAPSKARTALMTISLHRFAKGEPADLSSASCSPIVSSTLSDAPCLSHSLAFVSAFSIVAHQVNRAHEVLPHTSVAESIIDLSATERDVLTKCSLGLTPKEMAHQLGCAEASVNAHIQSALRLLSCGSKAMAVIKAARLGLIPCPQ